MEKTQNDFRNYRRFFLVILIIGLIAGFFFINEISFTNSRVQTFRRPLFALNDQSRKNQSNSGVVKLNHTSLSTAVPSTVAIDKKKKYVILMWTSHGGDWFYNDKVRDYCPLLKNSSCKIISNKNELNNSDVIFFHWRDVNLSELPESKLLNQKWVLINFEAPPSFGSSASGAQLGSKIDWTVTYRLDSDFYGPYGLLKPRNESEKWNEPTLEEFQSKKLLVWMVSNCHAWSNRNQFTKLLQKHVNVDIFGGCGKSTTLCPRGVSRVQCYANFSKHYKFYLSFENSICVDYATEKLFLPLAAGLIPVVLGGANYSKLVPKGSYIDIMDFETPEHLAKHLVEVGNNYTLYKSYFDWNKDSVVDFADLEDPKSRFWICDLCKKLFYENNGRTKEKNASRDVYKWFFDGGQCLNNPQWNKIQRYNPNSV